MREVTKGTTIIISHQERILNIADKIILLNEGKIDKVGEAKEIVGTILAKSNCCKLGGEV